MSQFTDFETQEQYFGAPRSGMVQFEAPRDRQVWVSAHVSTSSCLPTHYSYGTFAVGGLPPEFYGFGGRVPQPPKSRVVCAYCRTTRQVSNDRCESCGAVEVRYA
jgi:hypothetical protein